LLAAVALLPYFTKLKGVGGYVRNELLRRQSQQPFSVHYSEFTYQQCIDFNGQPIHTFERRRNRNLFDSSSNLLQRLVSILSSVNLYSKVARRVYHDQECLTAGV
jgi:hypothetical protein